MYISPNSLIYLYSGIPLDNDYINTFFFENEAQQRTFFLPANSAQNHYLFSFDNCYYVRDGVIRLQKPYNQLRGVNYMAFRNGLEASPANYKWYYAFIDDIRYVNNETTELYYTIDVMQTYLFDVELKHSYIERQHSFTDNVGDSLTPEPVELNEFVYNNYGLLYGSGGTLLNFSDCYIVVAYTEVSGDNMTLSDRVYDGVYSAALLKIFNTTSLGLGSLRDFLMGFVQTPDNVRSIYMCPKSAFGAISLDEYDSLLLNDSYGWSMETSQGNYGTSLDGYTPVNKKLFTAPYNFYSINDSNGGVLRLRYEFFTNNTVQLYIYSTISQPVQVNVRPYNYKNVTHPASGVLGTRNEVDTDSLTLGGFPLCFWGYDAYQIWISQNAAPMVLQMGLTFWGSTVGGAVGNLLAGQVVHQGLSGAVTTGMVARGRASEWYDAAFNTADFAKGSIAYGNANFSKQKLNFYGGRMSVNFETAQIIDEFFSRYGYAVQKIAVPNRHVREKFTYIKTLDCCLVGRAPSECLKKIGSIYDNGVTFWADKTNVGNYLISNPPLQVGG